MAFIISAFNLPKTGCGKNPEFPCPPLIAREKSLLISAMMVGEKMGVSVIDKNPQNLLAQIQDKIRKLEVVYSTPNGASVAMKADPNNPNDIEALLRASREF